VRCPTVDDESFRDETSYDLSLHIYRLCLNGWSSWRGWRARTSTTRGSMGSRMRFWVSHFFGASNTTSSGSAAIPRSCGRRRRPRGPASTTRA
jgi:hypothetical protein